MPSGKVNLTGCPMQERIFSISVIEETSDGKINGEKVLPLLAVYF
jgi:hypothetical protein